MLQYAVNQAGDENLQLVGPVFERQGYAIALQDASPLRERINPRHAPLAQRKPGRRVGADDDVGIAQRRGAYFAARAVGPNLPGAADVPEPDLEGRIEVAGGSEIPARQLRERLLDAPRALVTQGGGSASLHSSPAHRRPR